MSESEQTIMECPKCKELSLVPTNRILIAREGAEERKLPVLYCKTGNCRTSVAVDSDTVFILPEI